MMIVAGFESRTVDEAAGDGIGSSEVDFGLPLTFFTLPTRTTMARAGVAVWVLALFKNVEPTLKVLPVGLGGRSPLPLYFSKSTLGTGGVALPTDPLE
jgi:hypothetical protein